ncbi:MAG: RlmE family RNA methyltransferase [Alphaproteobacteria bacterium]|nr:RlmE family RNA methyltransferase [Alphaproteobacteria bacterium]
MARKSGSRSGRSSRGSVGGAGLGGARQKTVRVKTAKRRSNASARWLQRQLNDPYVAEARKRGYRSRAAFKLLELDDRYGFLKRGASVVDLGCAPGGWTQIAVKRANPNHDADNKVIGIDILAAEPVAGAEILLGDFMAPDAPDRLRAVLNGPVDVVLSDMAASSTGHAQTDHLRIIGLAEAALEFALEVLAPGGVFVAKVFSGGAEGALLKALKRSFAKVAHFKPPASRKESAETYVIALGFRGDPARPED